MIESIKGWWRNHGAGERALMGVLGAAIFIVFLWLGVWRPVNEALDTGWPARAPRSIGSLSCRRGSRR